MQRMAVILGGNAFVAPGERLTMSGQLEFARQAMLQLRPLFSPDTRLLISHGNGPQVGHILTRVEQALGKAYVIPLEVCVAESAGELGYVLEQALHNVLVQMDCHRQIAGLWTQVIVSADDPAFQNPTKPIGPAYDLNQAQQLRKQGFAIRPDADRGFRRVVPSPAPLEIVELDVIRQLFDQGVIVIAAGGGGIPVVQQGGQLHGIEAVVDKDLTGALLADKLDAQTLVILTGVPCAYRHFHSPRQEPIGCIDVGQAKQLVAEGHFAAGSMLPKMQAAIQFGSMPHRKTVICDPPSLAAALDGKAGTIIQSAQERHPDETV